MIAAWILYALVVSVLVAMAGRAFEEITRFVDLPVRVVWLVALLATTVLILSAPSRIVDPVAAGETAPVTELTGLVEAAGEHASEPAFPGGLAAFFQDALRSAAVLGNGPWGRVLTTGWILLSLILLAVGTGTLLHALRSRRRWPRRVLDGVTVRISPSAGPAVVGLVRPDIVIPAWLLDAPQEEQRMAVLHEREHLRAGDPYMLALGCLAILLTPWNPAVWWMHRRLRLGVELDCDRRVLRRGVRRYAYGSFLIDVAGHGSGAVPGVATLAASPPTLERRLLAMTGTLPRFAMTRAALSSVLGAALLFTACEARMPTAPEIEAMDVSAVEAHAERLTLVHANREDATYYLDGVQVPAEEAHALAADRIARVEVLRAGEGEPAQIRLTTRAEAADTGIDAASRRARVHHELRIAEPGDSEPRVIRVGSDSGAADPADGQDFEGLLLIDGVVSDPAGMRTLHPNRIESIEVLKGPEAARLYPQPEAANGVIRITTKS